MSLITINRPEFFPTPQPATVTKDFSAEDKGKVKFQGSYWRAKSVYSETQHFFQEKQTVVVIGREGLTLLVQPVL